MINIHLNEKLIEAHPNSTLAEFLKQQGYVEGGASVAVNRKFVPRAQYVATYLQEGDTVHVVSPMQGG